jgi:hypothetical protein
MALQHWSQEQAGKLTAVTKNPPSAQGLTAAPMPTLTIPPDSRRVADKPRNREAIGHALHIQTTPRLRNGARLRVTRTST